MAPRGNVGRAKRKDWLRFLMSGLRCLSLRAALSCSFGHFAFVRGNYRRFNHRSYIVKQLASLVKIGSVGGVGSMYIPGNTGHPFNLILI